MPEPRQCPRSPGFTMLELAIVLIIMGIIAGVAVPSVITAIKKEKISNVRESLASARQSIVAFALANRRLPVKNSAEDPTRNLKDPWGRAYTYTPATELTTTGSDICATTATSLSLQDSAGTTPNLAFFLSSTGPDGSAGISTTATLVNAASPGDDVSESMPFTQLYRVVCGQSQGAVNLPVYDFTDRNAVVRTPGTQVGVTVMPDGSVVMGFTDDQQTAASGSYGATNYSYGCIWYTGSAAGCNLGNCTLDKGMRAYFTFTMVRPAGYTGQLADGFTFTVASANTNKFGSCGGKGSAMGYASGYWYYPDDAGNAPFLVSPKIGVEFDPYRCFGDKGVDGNCDASTSCGMGGDYDHVAILYWGDENSAWGSSGTADGRRSRDDNTHASPTLASDTTPKNPACDAYTTNNQNGFLTLNSGTWFLNNAATEIPVRMEIKRMNPTAAAGTFKTTVWFNCQNCSDVTSNSTSFTTQATLNSTVTLSSTLTQQFKNVIFGFTEGTGGSRQRVTLKKQATLFY